MHTAFKRNHIKFLWVRFIQYNLSTSVAPENVSAVFETISVANPGAGLTIQSPFFLFLGLRIEIVEKRCLSLLFYYLILLF